MLRMSVSRGANRFGTGSKEVRNFDDEFDGAD